MLRTLTNIFRKKQATSSLQPPHTINPSEHALHPGLISKGAKHVIDTLGEHGYQAYIVGGCVRDLLLDLRPKDFDVATDATPEQVQSLFRRSRIIGRRFRIVHVRVGPEVIEVTTFRGSHSQENLTQQQSSQSSEGMLLRDNIFGSIDEDAIRRDFTINALYYHPQDNTIYDYANGQKDINDRLIRIIGTAETRYREDPVRMLRAVRFSAKLGFRIETATAMPILKLADLLRDIPSARLFDESLKLLLNGHSLATVHLLREYKLFDIMFPDAASALEANPDTLAFVEQALVNTDQRIRTNKRVTPAFIFAALLWPEINRLRVVMEKQGDSPQYALQRACSKALARQCQVIAIPKRFTIAMREIWELQLRLPQRKGLRAHRLLENKRFRAGYDFLLLREQAGEIESGLGDWWTKFQDVDEQQRQQMVEQLNDGPGTKKKRRRRRRKDNPAPSTGHD